MTTNVITEMKDIWVTFTNTDNTEGRGYNYPIASCESEATARRIGKKKYIQGSDCPVEKSIAVKINNTWYVPGLIQAPSREDIAEQAKIDAIQEVRRRAMAAGLSEDDLKLLRGSL